MKKKIIIIGVVLFLLLSVPIGILALKKQVNFRLGAQVANKPENVQVINITEQTATITWSTARAAQGLISYGISPTNLTLIRSETTPAINHQVTLNGLLPGTNYFFVIKIDNETFDNNGQPYSFTTKAEKTPSPTPTPSPSPTPTPTNKLTEEGLISAMGSTNPTYDLNKDGIVNVLDLQIFRQQSKE